MSVTFTQAGPKSYPGGGTYDVTLYWYNAQGFGLGPGVGDAGSAYGPGPGPLAVGQSVTIPYKFCSTKTIPGPGDYAVFAGGGMVGPTYTG